MQENLALRRSLEVIHYLCISSLSSFHSMEAHGTILNTKFVVDEFQRSEHSLLKDVDAHLCARVESFLRNVSLKHPFLLTLREVFLIDMKDRFSLSVSNNVLQNLNLV